MRKTRKTRTLEEEQVNEETQKKNAGDEILSDVDAQWSENCQFTVFSI